MQRIIRFGCSGFMGMLITAALFLGMMGLLGGSTKAFDTENLDFRISYVQAEVETKHRKRLIKKPPEIQKTSQPPAAPRMNTDQKDNALINIPNNFDSGKSLNILNKISLPGFSMDVGEPNIGSQGGVKAGMPPMYPPKALLKNIEGWVHVKISVNEMGFASEVIVLDSDPPRLFDAAAINAVKKWSFYQQEENGISVPFQLTQTIEFKIDQIEE